MEFREVINVVGSECGWRMLPVHFGPWQTVYGWFRELAWRFLFQTIHDVALILDRERAGREAGPSAAVMGQEDRWPQAHIAVDTDGRLLMVHPTLADISDSAGGRMILDGIRKGWPWVKHLFADGAYDRLKLVDKAAYLDFTVEVIRRSDDKRASRSCPAAGWSSAASGGYGGDASCGTMKPASTCPKP